MPRCTPLEAALTSTRYDCGLLQERKLLSDKPFHEVSSDDFSKFMKEFEKILNRQFPGEEPLDPSHSA